MWPNVKYEPGELTVVAYDESGNRVGEETVRTALEAKALKLDMDRAELRKGVDDLAYVTVSLVDKNGTELPQADDRIDVEVSGAGSFKAICNGDATSLESFVEPTMKLFNGKLVVTVKAGDRKRHHPCGGERQEKEIEQGGDNQGRLMLPSSVVRGTGAGCGP